MAGDRGADDLTIVRERPHRPQLVLTHQTAVAFHVSAQNRGKLALRRTLVHVGEFYVTAVHLAVCVVRFPEPAGAG